MTHKIFNRFFCYKCGNWFKTGRVPEYADYSKEWGKFSQDLCPKCGAMAVNWWEYIKYMKEKLKCKKK